MNRIVTGIVEQEARHTAAVLKARAAGVDPYAPVFVGSGRRPGLVDPVRREYPAWLLFLDRSSFGSLTDPKGAF